MNTPRYPLKTWPDCGYMRSTWDEYVLVPDHYRSQIEGS